VVLEERTMMDLFFVAVLAGLFVASMLMISAFDRMK
jgi:hypothetical protein